jgi:collagenase-like PrtC family protease
MELLAPAGSAACLKAAFIAGADAVYLAGKRFGARAFAANFDEKGLWWARRVADALGRKIYITLNTIVFEHEYGLLCDALDFYEALQPNALIIQDPGIAIELRRRKSRIPLHLSTQAAWFGQGGAEELRELGISRVILPRETTADEIMELSKKTDLELEVFVHGAMCYSISGRCFWSIALGTRSGNRGTCAQPCRKDYSICGSEKSDCFFSPRDLRLVEKIPALLSSGVASLKIEGRMKSPEYVFQVVKAYRQAIDGAAGDAGGMLDEVFSRSSSTGFFTGIQSPALWKTGVNTGREGVVAGTSTGRVHDGLVELKACEQIKPGDGLFWFIHGEKKGCRVTWIKADRKKSDHVWVRGIPCGIGAGVEIRRSSTADEGSWESLWNRDWERRPIDLFWSGHEGMKLAVETVINDHPLRLETEETLQIALNKGLEDGPLQEKFAVLGDLFKAGRHVTALLGKGLHISGSSLKKLKRSLVETVCKLEQLPPPKGKPTIAGLILSAQANTLPDYSRHFAVAAKSQIYLRVWNHSFPFLRDLRPDCWVLPWNGDNARADMVLHARIAHWLPPILNFRQFVAIVEQLSRQPEGEFFCMGWEAFALAKKLPQHRFILDWSFNVCNVASLDFIRSKGLDALLSREWKEEHIPENLTGFHCSQAWNPLVSLSRFVPAVKPGNMLQNSHNDRFFQIDIGNGVTAMFLADKPAALVRRGNASIFMDIAVAPDENPVQVARDLNRMLESFRNG